jgi:hypothetical protein
MKKWSQKIRRLSFSLGLLFAPLGVNAQNCNPFYSPCNWDYCDRGFELTVDYLLWKPCIDDLDFAFSFRTSSGTTDVIYKEICPEWESGVRVSIEKYQAFSGLNLHASWTYIKSDDTRDFEPPSGGNVSSTLLHPGLRAILDPGAGGRFKEAEGDWELSYNDWDLLLYRNISCNLWHEFSPFFGVAAITVDQELEVDLTNPEEVNNEDEAEIRWTSYYWGVGLRAGTHYFYRFNETVGFFARAEGTLLAGDATGKNTQQVSGDGIDPTEIELKDDACCHFLPGYHLGAGFIVHHCFCCYEFTLRLGYEFVEWHNVPNHRNFSGDNIVEEASHSSSPSTRTLGFHGMFAGLVFNF